nr:TetR/AcrR family transcriptional regulator [uncultured Undibacterium sp.]
MNANKNQVSNDALSSPRILDAARSHIRRHGESKTNVVDIARILGTSHTTIYRHFKSKAEVFDAIVLETMAEESELAKTFVDSKDSAKTRLKGLVIALHRRKKERFGSDPEIYQLYRRVVEERPDIVKNYAVSITRLLATILEDGVNKGEFKLNNVQAAAEVVRDAVTVFVHPSHVEMAMREGNSSEQPLERILETLIKAFTAGLTFHI